MFKWIADIIKSIANSNMSSGAKATVIIVFLLSFGVGYVYVDYRKRDKEKLEIASKQNDKFDLVINKLVDKGNTVVVVEHNMDVIKMADWIIDLGPGGGEFGGKIVAEGTPEQVIKNSKSVTGKFLKAEFF